MTAQWKAERAMAWFPCPVCGKEAKAEVRTTFLPEQYVPTDDGGGTFVDEVLLRYRVKKQSQEAQGMQMRM